MPHLLRRAALALALIAAPLAGWATTFTGPSGAVAPGGSFSVIGEIGDEEIVGFDLSITMDKGLTLTGLTLPNGLTDNYQIDYFDANFDSLSNPFPVDGFLLVTVSSTVFPESAGDLRTVILDFMVAQDATGSLSIGFAGEFASPVLNLARMSISSRGAAAQSVNAPLTPFGPVDVTIRVGNPSVIPLPAAAPLLLSGLAGLGALGLRRRRAA